MARIEEQIDVAGSPRAVFRFCHDTDRRPEWDERVTRVKIITPGPVRRGSVARFDTPPPRGGGVFSWEGEFVAYTHPTGSRLAVIDAAPSSYFVDATEEWSFTGSAEGTRVSLTWEYTPRGIVGRITDALGGRRSTRRAVGESLANLKRMLQAEM